MKGQKSEFASRYIQAVEAIKNREKLGIRRDADFCRAVGILPQTLIQIRKGNQDVSTLMLKTLTIRFGVSVEFLLNGTGSIFGDLEPPSEAKIRLLDLIDNDLIPQHGGSARAFLKGEDYGHTSLSEYRRGKVKEIPALLKNLLIQKYNVNWDYILTGDGEKFGQNLSKSDKPFPDKLILPNPENQLQGTKVFREPDQENIKGSNLRVLTVSVNSDNEENVILVPVTAAASYVRGFADPVYIGEMPGFSFPGLPRGITMRAFEVEGDSMFPTVSPGDIAVCSFVEDWNHIKEGYVHIVVAEDGVYCKRLRNHIKVNGTIQCISDNLFYTPYDLHTNEVNEIWQVRRLVTAQLPAPNDTDNRLVKLETTVKHLTEVLRKRN